MQRKGGSNCPLSPGMLAMLLGFSALCAPAPAEGQQQAGGSARAALEAPVRFTGLHDGTSVMAGGVALLGLGTRFSVGGAGWLLLRDSPIRIGSGPSALDLTVGYGGVMGEARLVGGANGSLSLRMLLGVGSATVSLAAVDTEIASDNFGVFEPEVSGSFRIAGPLHLTAGAGYRFAIGVQDLPEVAPGDMSAPVFNVGLSLLQF